MTAMSDDELCEECGVEPAELVAGLPCSVEWCQDENHYFVAAVCIFCGPELQELHGWKIL